ncbi:DUF1481 domain-containing protein [Enterovibrio norvegicus]|uniref:DUF1481 domain-containing protein n=1 Tax=Enterovibrio norvegicus TaxID=188144 RepID=UPI003D0F0652
MHRSVKPLLILFTVALTGCGSTESIQPPTLSQTANVQGDATSIYWLDERQSFPETLTEKVLLGDYGQYSSEYRWRKGVVREIQREGDVLIDGKLKHQAVLIRYDSEGEAVYQQYRVDGDLLPLRTTELVRYAREAEQALANTREQVKKKQTFFQGYWSEGVLEACNTGKEKALTFNVSFPDYLFERLNKEDNFLAAVGKVGRKENTVDTIIALDKDSADCFERPSFN